MTLGRQLIIAISFIFLAALTGVEALYVRNARLHLQEQLESHAQDAATSIGLSLGILLTKGDSAIAETVINAAFDRGHYAQIEFAPRDGREPVVRRRLSVDQDEHYPQWFADMFPLVGPTAESLVSSGWQQIGRVRVTSHPRFAYEQLWATARGTGLLLAAIYLVALALLLAFLRSVLRPLAAVEKAALSIARRDFVTVDADPGTRELARVVTAMNSLSMRVREALEAETARAASLQDEVFMDAVSGLPNRRGLTSRFNSHFRDETESFGGMFALLQITALARVNEVQGPERGDELLRSVGRLLGEAGGSSGLAGRWGGALFALVIEGDDRAAAEAHLAEVERKAESIVAGLGLIGTEVRIAVGAVWSGGSKPVLKDLVDNANDALLVAAEKDHGTPEVRVLDSARPAWSAELIGVVRQSIGAGRMALMGQPAIALHDGSVLHTEIMGRLLDAGGKQLNAAEFMPLVSRHRLTVDLDQAVVRRVLQALHDRAPDQAGNAAPSLIAVNIAAQSVADPGFADWLAGALGRGLRPGVRLVFEVSEHGVLENEAAARRFAARMQEQGVLLAIDHFGVHRDSLALVRRLMPAYVKLSAVHTPRIVSDMGTRFFIESVARAGRQLEVPVIAQNVEDELTVANLKSLGVQGYQGYVAGRPAAWG